MRKERYDIYNVYIDCYISLKISILGFSRFEASFHRATVAMIILQLRVSGAVLTADI